MKGFDRLINTEFVLQEFTVNSDKKLIQGNLELSDFASSEYLGLSNDIIQDDIEKVKVSGLRNGWSRISGNTNVTKGFEKDLQTFLGFESARLAQSISLINITIFNSLSKMYDYFLYDKDVHITLKLGMKNIDKTRQSFFPNNNLEYLENELSKLPKNSKKLIVIDGVYSMKGEVAPVERLQLLMEKYNCDILIDDAHGFGVIGSGGRGVSALINPELKKRVIYISSFSKCASNPVAFICSSKEICEKLDKSATFLIYSGPPSNLHVLISNRHLKAFESNKFKEKREILYHSSCDIHQFLFEQNIKFLSKPGFPIISVRIDPDYLEAIISVLKFNGIFAKPAIHPVVQFGDEVIRFTLTVNNCRQSIGKLKKSLIAIKKYTIPSRRKGEISI